MLESTICCKSDVLLTSAAAWFEELQLQLFAFVGDTLTDNVEAVSVNAVFNITAGAHDGDMTKAC